MVKRLSRWMQRLDETGQAIVEFAMVAPILLLLILGIVDFGRAFMIKQVLVDAAREGGRVAVVADPNTTIDTVAYRINLQLAAAGVDTAAAVKSVSGFHGGTGVPATVSITYPYSLIWIRPFMGWTGAQGSITISTSVTFRNE